MSIIKYTNDEIAKFKIGCPTMSNLNIGTTINSIIDSVNASSSCSVDISAYKHKINTMCSFNGCFLGDVLDDIIKACNDASHEAAELNDVQIKALNGTCGTLNGLKLGTKLEEMIEYVNQHDPVKHLISIDIPQEFTVNIGETKIMNITFNPSDATDKTYSIINPSPAVVTATSVSDGIQLIGVASGMSDIEIVPTDGGESLKKTCRVYVPI